MTEFISPVMRLVQGSTVLREKKDENNKPVLDKETGQPVQECFIAVAIAKDDPQLQAFYALYQQTAMAAFPQLFDANGNCLHPRFAWKVQDGDGVDKNGKPVSGKPGFAGHYIFKMATRFQPACYHYGKYDPSQRIPNPADVIKPGYFVRVSGKIEGNGVGANAGQAVPGLYVSPNMIELIAYGQEIVSGPDAAAVFGAAPVVGNLPAGASTTPPLPTNAAAANGLAAPQVGGGLPGVGGGAPGGLAAPGVGPGAGLPTPGIGGAAAAPAPSLGLPGAGGAGLALPGAGGGLGAPPAGLGAPPQGPVYQMQPSAQGATRESLNALGWTDDMLIQAGHMIRVS